MENKMNPALRHLCPVAVLLLLPGAVWSQSAATGYREGSRNSAGKSQALMLRVERSNGLWKATVDLADLGALDIPAAAFSMTDGRMHFELIGDTSTAVFEGNVAADSIRGTWHEEG
jgi:hypothetical protein